MVGSLSGCLGMRWLGHGSRDWSFVCRCAATLLCAYTRMDDFVGIVAAVSMRIVAW